MQRIQASTRIKNQAINEGAMYAMCCRSRDDVGHCLWLYLDYFEAHYEHMTRSEIFMCAMVCYVCTQCAGTLR